MLLSTVGFAVQIWGILLTFAVFDVSEGSKLTLTPDQGSTINISRSTRGSKCDVCTVEGRKKSCSSFETLTGKSAVSVEFTCPNPEKLFTVEVVRAIVCSSKSCSGDVDQTDSGSLPLRDFNRTFTWDLKASGPQAFRLNFSKTGLRQIRPTDSCPDQHTYILWAFQKTVNVTIGTYCRGGSITGAQILRSGRLSLVVPARQKLEAGLFDVSVGEEIKSFASITVTLPEEVSSTELFSPNYPDFPDDDQVEWQFFVPPKHNRTVRFLDYRQPHCLKKEPGVEYQGYGSSRGGQQGTTLLKRLAEAQPPPQPGSFSLILRNCKINRTKPGLSLHFNVSATRRSHPVLCPVDMSKKKDLSLHIEKKKAGSDCEMKLNSVIQENITVPAGRISQLSFQDCSRQELLLTARRIIECRQMKDCPAGPVLLTVPDLGKCLPAPLQSMTWSLRPPKSSTVELLPPTGGLSQTLSGQLCNVSVLSVAEDCGTYIGQFCPQGAISKVQVHTNVSITVSAMGKNELRHSSQPFLKVSFSKEITERYIFTVNPKKKVPLSLATPAWPAGMKPYSTVSWIVTVPTKMEAHLNFINVSQPKCSNRHTSMRVQSLGSLEEKYSRREDEKVDKITVSESFYLNMSNCMPERGAFRVVTEITLHPNKKWLLTIILSVVVALLVVMVAVLAVVCLVIRRKKKRQLAHQVSIYNPNGTSFLPGHNGFPKSRQDNESHVYASIEDTMVYTHLLRDGAKLGIHGVPEVEVYESFTGPTDAPQAEGVQVGIYQHYVPPSHQAPPVPNRPASQRAVLTDNDLYSSE